MQKLGFPHVIIVPDTETLNGPTQRFLERVEAAAGGVTVIRGFGLWQGVHEPILRIEARGREMDMEQRHAIEREFRAFTVILLTELGEKAVYREQKGIVWIQGPLDHLPKSVPGGGGLAW